MSKSNRYKQKKMVDPHVYQKRYSAYSEDIELNKFSAVIGFFPPMFWWPLVRCPKSNFGRQCANQGLILLLLAVVGGAAALLTYFITQGMLGDFYYYELVIYGFLVLEIAFMMNGIIAAYEGRLAKVPLLGRLNLIKPREQ